MAQQCEDKESSDSAVEPRGAMALILPRRDEHKRMSDDDKWRGRGQIRREGRKGEVENHSQRLASLGKNKSCYISNVEWRQPFLKREQTKLTGKSQAREQRRGEAVAARLAKDEGSAREWRLEFWSRDGIKQLHSALQLAEVLRERCEMKVLNAAVTSRAIREDQQQREHERTRARETVLQERGNCSERRSNKTALREALCAQMREKKMINKLEEQAELLKEKQFMQKLSEEIKAEEEKRKTEAGEKQRRYVSELRRLSEEERLRRKHEQDVEEMNLQLSTLHSEHRHKLRHAVEQQRKVALQAAIEKRETFANNTLMAFEARKAREQRWLNKTQEEKSKKERAASAARAKQQLERHRNARELLTHQMRTAEAQRMEQTQRANTADREARSKHDQVTAAFRQQQRELRSSDQQSNAKAYDQQKEDNRLLVMTERVQEAAATARQCELWALEDRQFLQYAHQVLEEACLMGRSNAPLKKLIQDYKKRFDVERQSTEKEFTKSHLDIGIDVKRVEQSRRKTILE